jgi:hypothetical protein
LGFEADVPPISSTSLIEPNSDVDGEARTGKKCPLRGLGPGDHCTTEWCHGTLNSKNIRLSRGRIALRHRYARFWLAELETLARDDQCARPTDTAPQRCFRGASAQHSCASSSAPVL